MRFQEALDRMPHAGAMRLIEEVVSLDETSIECIAGDHRDASYPLRIDGCLYAAALVELGAQAAAAHASLHGVEDHHTGLLLALHGVEILDQTAQEHAARLRMTASQLHFDATGARYDFAVFAQDAQILKGQAMLMMQAMKP